jgi:hypothetical protein
LTHSVHAKTIVQKSAPYVEVDLEDVEVNSEDEESISRDLNRLQLDNEEDEIDE